MPSRATEMKPMKTTAHSPLDASARSTPFSSVAFIERAVFCIQKIIQVTSATVTSDRIPPISSCASKVSV